MSHVTQPSHCRADASLPQPPAVCVLYSLYFGAVIGIFRWVYLQDLGGQSVHLDAAQLLQSCPGNQSIVSDSICISRRTHRTDQLRDPALGVDLSVQIHSLFIIALFNHDCRVVSAWHDFWSTGLPGRICMMRLLHNPPKRQT